MTLWRPSMYGRNLVLKGRIYKAMPREGGLLCELGGDDYSFEHLAAAA